MRPNHATHLLNQIHETLNRILLVTGEPQHGYATLTLDPFPLTLEKPMLAPFSLPQGGSATGKLTLTDPNAKLDAAPTFTTSDPALVVAADANDPTVFHVTLNGVPAAEPVKSVAHCVSAGVAFDIPIQDVFVTVPVPAPVPGTSSLTLDPPAAPAAS